jgi:hypothetical protein
MHNVFLSGGWIDRSRRSLDELETASKKSDNRKISPVASFIEHETHRIEQYQE